MKERKYYSLYKTLREAILKQEYKAGEKLPSKRAMANLYGYSLVTVESAYALLEDEGYIAARQRSGYFVCSIASGSYEAQSQNRPPHLPEDLGEAAADFEYSVWFKTVRRVLTERERSLFIKSPSKGCAVLRNAISDYLYRYRGMRADPRRILIGSGAEQLYETAVKLLGRDKIYGIEDPSYEQIEAVYRAAGCEVCRLSMGEDGIRSDALQENEFDALHVTPFHSFPSGVTTSVSKRYEYLNLAKERGLFIIEDDFDSEFFIPGNPIESLYSLDGGENVIYINTFSKSLSPAMRMGYMILPPALLEEYDRRFEGRSCTVPVLDQYILAEFIDGGHFERHLNRMRRRLTKP